MTKEEFQNLKVGDTVAINGITGKVTEKDDTTYVLKSKHFDCGDGWMRSVSLGMKATFDNVAEFASFIGI